MGRSIFPKGMKQLTDTLIHKKSPSHLGMIMGTEHTRQPRPVAKVSPFRYASETARGMAPHAKVVGYKVCWKGGCLSSNIIKGMDMAVQESVDIMLISVGGGNADYDQDSVVIGAFGAISKGIFGLAATGNTGPSNILLSSVAPWITTVGTSTIDRDFPVHIRLTGVSLYSGKPLPTTLVFIIYAADASNISTSDGGNPCINGSLIPSKVAGKIVIWLAKS